MRKVLKFDVARLNPPILLCAQAKSCQRRNTPRRSLEPAHVLAELKREMGPIAFSAQYQQSPIPPGGTIIKRKWLTPYDDVDHQPGDRIITSWDIALSETNPATIRLVSCCCSVARSSTFLRWCGGGFRLTPSNAS